MLQKRLLAMADSAYRDFHAKLIPNVEKERIIGVRTPDLRKFAREIIGSDEAIRFLKDLPHKYYDENNLHAFLIEQIADFDQCIAALDVFLPYVDNWATCDMLSPKVFKRHRAKLLPHIRRWMDSDHVYTVRFGIDMLMKHFLDEDFLPETMAWVAVIRTDEYYLKMAQAWYFATALTRQYEAALPFIKEEKLDKWTHNKAVQKAVESRCISPECKCELRKLKRS